MLVPIKAETKTMDKQTTEYYNYGDSRSVSFLRVMTSTVLMNFQIMKRYKANLIGGLIQTFLLVAVFGLFANVLEFTIEGVNLVSVQSTFIFLMAAIVIMSFQSTSLYVPVRTVTRDLTNGTLEYLYFCPSSKYAYFVGTIVADALITFVLIFLPSFVLLYLIANASPLSMAAVLLVSSITFITLIAFGIMIAMLAIIWKEVQSLVNLLGMVFLFFGGGFFPLQIFPEPIQFIALFFPYTFGFDLIRYFSFEGTWNTILPVEIEILLLILYAIVYIMLSYYLLERASKYAKKQGLHLI